MARHIPRKTVATSVYDVLHVPMIQNPLELEPACRPGDGEDRLKIGVAMEKEARPCGLFKL